MKREEVRNLPDWEYLDDYYSNETGKELKLEDFQTEQDKEATNGDIFHKEGKDERFDQILKEVGAVRIGLEKNKSVEDIAAENQLSPERVKLIHMCMFGGSVEDTSDVAVAHLVMMEDA